MPIVAIVRLLRIPERITDWKYIEKNQRGKIIYKIIYSVISGSPEKGWK
jgi:hypothetical protein